MKCIHPVAAIISRPPWRALCCALLLSTAAALPAENLYHTVKNGDTVYALARRYQVKEADILLANGIADARKIYVGQKLRIPGTAEAVAAAAKAAPPVERLFVEYRAAAGDTLYGIARTYGISYQELAAANNFPPAYVLKAGNKIKVPLPQAGKTGAAPQPAGKSNGAQTPAQAPAAPTKPAPKTPAKTGNPLDALEWPVVPTSSAYMKGKLSGVVLTGEKTEPVRSLTAGTVVSAGPYRGFGRVVIVKSDGGYDYVYGGCESLTVKKWDRVVPGSEVGKLGVDALTAKPQLFFMIYHNGKPVDPAKTPRA
jgi:murein DD-endopeptidase MepM/ murein hydrolase activator NlpD